MTRVSNRNHLLLRSLAYAFTLLPATVFLCNLYYSGQSSWRLRTSTKTPPSEFSLFPPASSAAAYYGSEGVHSRRRFKSYQEYLELQLNKTLNPKLRKVWTTSDWRRKIDVFSLVFKFLFDQGLLRRSHKVLCIGARVGQEVVALKEIGVTRSVGIDLVAAPPLVVKGDIHSHPFADNTFDFEFSNVFDHALFPRLFVSEIERTLKPRGVAVLHVALQTWPDKFSATDLRSVEALVALFAHSDLVHVRQVDALGLDTEVAMRKRMSISIAPNLTTIECSKPKLTSAMVKQAEALIAVEPKKPWIALKKNIKKVNYLPSITDISRYKRHIYVDVGARNYGSSIGSWFKKQYPKQGRNFTIFAVEADRLFEPSYDTHPDVTFVPYAAWIRNESLLFGSQAKERKAGMGRIHHQHGSVHASVDRAMAVVQGMDFAEWIRNIARKEDFLLVKMDVEGAEFFLLPWLFETGAICLVDELFLECHYNRWQSCCPGIRSAKFNKTYQDCLSLLHSLRRNGVFVHQWW